MGEGFRFAMSLVNQGQMDSLVRSIHAAPVQLVIVSAGGGSGAVAALARMPGASKTLLHAAVPYSESALRAFLRTAPESLCSQETAADIARRALEMATAYGSATARDLIGVGVTAALATDRQRRGQDRCYLSVAGEAGWINRRVIFDKDVRQRGDEEDLVDALVLNAIAEACDLAERLPLDLLSDERIAESILGADYWHLRVLDGRVAWFRQGIEGELTDAGTVPGAILAGAFDPLHDGHLELASAATEMLGMPVVFELSVTNVDKPPLDVDGLQGRLRAFRGKGDLFVGRAATFVEKCRLFPGCVFVIGADTAPRVVDPRYYDGSVGKMRSALDELAGAGCSFLVAGRADDGGGFVGLDGVEIPPEYAGMFESIPETRFRMDVSSTELREPGKRA